MLILIKIPALVRFNLLVTSKGTYFYVFCDNSTVILTLQLSWWCYFFSCSIFVLFPSPFSLLFCCPEFFFLFLKYIIIRVQLMSLTGSALTSSGPVLEVAGMNSYLGWGTFWTFLTEAKPAGPVLLKPCHITPPYRHISFSFRSLWSTGNPSRFWL